VSLEDKSIDCCDCGEGFVWTMKDQDFYEKKKFSPPKRCKACREKKKKAIAARGKKQQ
jgi:hypothetical protein